MKALLIFTFFLLSWTANAQEYTLNMKDYVRADIRFSFHPTEFVKQRITYHVIAYVYKKANPDFEYAFTAGSDFTCDKSSNDIICRGEYSTEGGSAFDASFKFMADGASPVVLFEREK